MISPVGDSGISDDATERDDNEGTNFFAIVGVYGLSAAITAVVLALALLRVIDVVR